MAQSSTDILRSMSTSPDPKPGTSTAETPITFEVGSLPDYPADHVDYDLADPDPRVRSASQVLGILRIDIHGSWSVTDLIKLLGRLEDGYKAAAALESLTGQPSGATPSRGPQSPGAGPVSASLSADDLLQTVTAFQLAGGLRLGSLRYGSPGFLEVIGALNPLKTVKDGITENREINRKRDETRRLDERDRGQQAMQHEEAMARESRAGEQQQQSYALEVARLQLQAEAARFNVMTDLIDRLPADQQSVAAAQLLQVVMGATESIANDARIDGARMLEQADATSAQSPHAPNPGPEDAALHRATAEYL
jgi:hypothetical protein